VLTGDHRERVEAILARLPLVHIEMEPGDAFYFHANLLHRSDRNESENPRWSMICCYNAARNDPYKDAHHPRYTPLIKVPDTAILTAGAKRFADSHDDVAWLDINRDSSATKLAPPKSADNAASAPVPDSPHTNSAHADA
jgi:hypothetical protein